MYSPFGWNFETGKIDIGGKGDALVTFTARSDVIRFLGHVLVNVPASKLEWTKFSLEGQRTVRPIFSPLSFVIPTHAIPSVGQPNCV